MYLTGSPELAKQVNRYLVYEFVRTAGTTSRVQIARATRLSKPTVSAIVAELIQEGYLREVGSRATHVGRPRSLLEFNPQARYAVGAEIGGQACQVVLIDLQANVLQSVIIPLPGLDVETVLRALVDGVRQAVQSVDAQQVLGVGVGVPGLIDPSKNLVTYSVVLGWQEAVPLGDLLSHQLGLRVTLLHRVMAAAWGEKWYGAGQQADHLLYIRVGSGVAAGLILNGQLYLGQTANAGEFGHMTILPDGPLCNCGNQGCIAALVSSQALIVRARHLLRTGVPSALSELTQHHLDRLTLEHLIQVALDGDPVAAQVIREAGEYLGIAVANLVNLLNPGLVIIGGPLSQAGPLLFDALRAEVRRRALSSLLAVAEIIPSPLGSQAAAVGAAGLILRQVMAPGLALMPGAGAGAGGTGILSLPALAHKEAALRSR